MHNAMLTTNQIAKQMNEHHIQYNVHVQINIYNVVCMYIGHLGTDINVAKLFFNEVVIS